MALKPLRPISARCTEAHNWVRTINSADRAAHPLYRTDRRAEFVQTYWDMTLERIASKFQQLIGRYGPDSVAFYGSGQLDSESLISFASSSRASSAPITPIPIAGFVWRPRWPVIAAAWAATPRPACYEDIDLRELSCYDRQQHGRGPPCHLRSASSRQEESPRNADRRCRSASDGDRSDRRPASPRSKPGGDIALLNAIGRILVDAGMIDEHFIARLHAVTRSILAFSITQDLGDLCRPAGLERSVVSKLARLIGNAKGS